MNNTPEFRGALLLIPKIPILAYKLQKILFTVRLVVPLKTQAKSSQNHTKSFKKALWRQQDKKPKGTKEFNNLISHLSCFKKKEKKKKKTRAKLPRRAIQMFQLKTKKTLTTFPSASSGTKRLIEDFSKAVWIKMITVPGTINIIIKKNG